jgi:uncharacterized damage-inducible protein DinB
MHYPFIAIPDAEIPRAVEPGFQHLLDTYVSETNKTASVWRAVPDSLLDFQPVEKTNSIRAILIHQILSERRFFAQFVGTDEPPAEELLPGDDARIDDYVKRYVALAKCRLPQFASQTGAWWLEERPFFEDLPRKRIWIYWRRVLHTFHHRTQVQTWLRLAGATVPPIYGPSGDVTWEGADPTNSLEAAGRGG